MQDGKEGKMEMCLGAAPLLPFTPLCNQGRKKLWKREMELAMDLPEILNKQMPTLSSISTQ